MARGFWALLVVVAAVHAAFAEAPETSPRPVPRPAVSGDMARPEAAPAPTAGLARSLRPIPRPQIPAVATAAPAEAALPPPQAQPRRGLFAGVFGRPRARPEDRPAAQGGYVCGDRAILGRVLEPIGNPAQGCGIAEPVQVTSVDGVVLSQAATMDCATASALHAWIDEGLRPAFRGRDPVQLVVAAHYVCRGRNNRPGARISEHGRGRAIDIAGIAFADGSAVSVADDYGRALRRAHRAACGIFGTTLGPGSDGYHEDHLHFDTASHRNGPYCR